MNTLKLKKLYAKATKESPYFCDSLLPMHLDKDQLQFTTKCNSNKARNRIIRGHELHNLMWNELLDCTVWYATDNMANDKYKEAMENLYLAMVVIMRTMDVLEGKQKLGEVEDAGNQSDK